MSMRLPDEEREWLGLGVSPVWADRWGQDRHGVFASFVIGGVAQRMRWIRSGSFIMGSPEDEPGRWNDEGPQHRVTLTEGFWMADTPCTQALWQVLMDSNPSGYKSPRRPVESVSWEQVQEFLARLNEQRPQLNAGLPTEEQWEYACRAGTTTATYAGPIEILGERNAPILDEIAWYGGNSGVDFDLPEGWNSSDWSEKQHPHERAGTREVGLKRPNAWGLHDMLGNVREWCANQWRDYDHDDEDVVGPVGVAGGAARVTRGGCWNAHAHGVRAAARYAYEPGIRYGPLGFRLVRGQGFRAGERSESKPQIAKPSDSRPAPPLIAVPRHEGGHLPTPAWAFDAGYDEYGRWASFRVDDVVQRMRRIDPGSFIMGSPADEPGRSSREGPQHRVTLTKVFWIADTPCTQALWQAVMGWNPSRFKSPRRPVEQVSWREVETFLEQLNERSAGLKVGLPTEAQWEYACRAGTTTATYTGPMQILHWNSAPILDEIAWYAGNSDVRVGTREVGLKRPNDWGLYDMLGNVWEWCADNYGRYAVQYVVNPKGRSSGVERVLRGGGWHSQARRVRAAFRLAYEPGYRSGDLGFRLVRSQ
jgi:formylglycine-generating enzyme required for sulfatase activity